jgi:3'-5' exoribonuclease
MDNGTRVISCFCVKTRKSLRDYVKGFRFDVTLADKSGEIELTYWGGNNEIGVKKVYDSFAINDVVWVSGLVSVYRNEKRLNINEGNGVIRPATSSEYQLDDFFHTTNQNIEEMWNKIVETKNSFTDPNLKNLLEAFCGDAAFVEEFKKIPAAMYVHHACFGGLLEHTWEVLRYCELTTKIHYSLNKDLLFTGAILHDIGKMKEYSIGINVNQSREGMLLGHIFIGTELVLEKISKIESFPSSLKRKVIHMILSHHGKIEYGAFQEPAIPEAAALHYADLMSATVTQYIRTKKDAPTDDFKIYTRRLGAIFLE